MLALKASGIDGMAVGDGTISQAAINAFHRNGQFVDVYTVNDSFRLQQLVAMGVDSIETDRPDLLYAIVFSGDYNRNGAIDAADYVVWRNMLGQSGTNLAADGDGNQFIDDGDYAIWRSHFGRTGGIGAGAAEEYGSEAPAHVPEPASLLMLLLGCIAMLVIDERRRHAEWDAAQNYVADRVDSRKTWMSSRSYLNEKDSSH